MRANKHLLIVLLLAPLLTGCQFAAPTTGVTPTPPTIPVTVPTRAATLNLPVPTLPPVTRIAEASPTPRPPSPTVPVASATLAIQSFTANIQDIPTGKRLTFAWQATGGTSARIYSGAGSAKFPDSTVFCGHLR